VLTQLVEARFPLFPSKRFRGEIDILPDTRGHARSSGREMREFASIEIVGTPMIRAAS
jgi:hypothetical protein